MEQIVTSSKKVSLGKKLAALVAVGAVVLLSGCSNVDAAATVGKEVVTTSHIQTSVASIMKLRSTIDASQLNLPTGAELGRRVLGLQISTLIIKQAAATQGVVVTPAEVAKMRNSQIAAIGGTKNLSTAMIQSALAAEDLDTYFTYGALMEKLSKKMDTKANSTASQTFLNSYMPTVKVQLNPRYGRWDSTTGTIVPVDTTSGAVATPSPAASK